jgi:tetratricopeptide (TPR) repeat protein
MTFSTELNNVGVSFIQTGNIDEAFQAFKAAIELMRKTPNTKLEDRPGRRRSLSDIDEMKAKSDFDFRMLSETGCKISAEGITACFVSKAAVAIPDQVGSREDNSLVTAILLFNLALSLHLLALDPGMERFLHKALRLYKLSKKLVTQHLENDRDDNTEISLQLVLSIFNNMGHIYYEFGDYSTSRTYFEGLTTMVARNACNSRKQSGEVEELLLNALVLNEPHAAAAA